MFVNGTVSTPTPVHDRNQQDYYRSVLLFLIKIKSLWHIPLHTHTQRFRTIYAKKKRDRKQTKTNKLANTSEGVKVWTC